MSIVLDGISKAFGEKRVLQDVSLDVHEGETVAVIGASGVGKSVLLKTIVGLLTPDTGTAEVDGEVVTELSKEELHLVPRVPVYKQSVLHPNTHNLSDQR